MKQEILDLSAERSKLLMDVNSQILYKVNNVELFVEEIIPLKEDDISDKLKRITEIQEKQKELCNQNEELRDLYRQLWLCIRDEKYEDISYLKRKIENFNGQ